MKIRTHRTKGRHRAQATHVPDTGVYTAFTLGDKRETIREYGIAIIYYSETCAYSCHVALPASKYLYTSYSSCKVYFIFILFLKPFFKGKNFAVE